MHGPHRAGFPQNRYWPIVTLRSPGHYGRYPHPLSLLEHRFRVAVGIGFVLVVAVLIQGPHLMAKMPGLVNVTVAQANGLITAPASVVIAEFVGFVGPHRVALGIVGKRELDTGSHELRKCAKEKSELVLELFC